MKRWMPWFGFGLLALLVLGPLLGPGYILTLDMKWVPRWHAPTVVDHGFVFYSLLHLLNIIIPSMILQKLLLFCIFVLAGVGAYRLVDQRVGGWPAALAGLLYTMNPFVYARFLTGQYLVLLGYALLPWYVQALERFLKQPDYKTALTLVACLIGIGLSSIHALGFVFVLSVAVVLGWSWGSWRRLGAMIPWGVAIAALWFAANAFWLKAASGQTELSRTIGSFDRAQFEAYATLGGHAGVPLNTLALQGFWGEAYGRYVLPSITGWLFWVSFSLIMALVALGVWRSVTQRDRLGLALVGAAILAWVLAMGVAWSPGAFVSTWLIDHVPWYRGYREPHKWLALVALAYAYLGAIGLQWVGRRLQLAVRESVMVAILMLPFAWTPMLLWGASGQLRSVDYPASWYELNRRLAATPTNSKVLILPWHQYIYLDFAGRTVAQPAGAFFSRTVISSDNAELLGTAAVSSRPENRVIEESILTGSLYRHDIGTRLAALGIDYVVVLKQADWQLYNWLNHQNGLVFVDETSGWKRYRVKEAY